MQTRTARSTRQTVRLAGYQVTHNTVTAPTQAAALYALLVANLPKWPTMGTTVTCPVGATNCHGCR